MQMAQIDRYSSGLEVRLEGELPGARPARGLSLWFITLALGILVVCLPDRWRPGLLSTETALMAAGAAFVLAATAGLVAGVLHTLRPVSIIEVSEGRFRVRPGGGEPALDAPLAEVTLVLADRCIVCSTESDEHTVNAGGHLQSSLIDVVDALEETIAEAKSA